MQSAQVSREDVLKDVSSILCEFLEVAVHCILFHRAVYPPEIFDPRRMYGVPVRQSRHKALNDYIAQALTDAKHWMHKGMVESVVVAIEDASTHKQLERFVFEVSLDPSARHDAEESSSRMSDAQAARVATQALDVAQLEDSLRQVLLKIQVCDAVLKPLGKETSFSIYIHTKKDYMVDSTDQWEVLDVEEGSIAGVDGAADATRIHPLKSLTAGVLKLQLFAETERRR
mmetsp:Transcript_3640/g.7285  ORF Transcript_3640/g.7285 Transcript_3640/m.7285 type:complete len:229 (+) Transcript_3640:55-741(+)